MFRLIGFLVTFLIGAGAFLAVDYNMSKRWSGTEDGEGLTLAEYFGGLTNRLTGMGASSGKAKGLPTNLADMLPRPPEGWTVRPTTADDAKAFLPGDRSSLPREKLAYVTSVADAASGRGVESVQMTYERGERKVIFQLIRYPDLIFTSFMAMQQRFELQMRAAEFSGTQFMTVRGLDVSEDLLPEEIRARLFFADVGAQMHLRVLAPDRMKDTDLVPFFETLHVEAMNADVVDKQEGLGEVPVIVLASVMDDITRAAYEEDLARRQAEYEASAEAERLEAEEKAAAEAAKAEAESKDSGGGLFGGLFGGSDSEEETEAETATGATVTCQKGVGGSKKCQVTQPAAEE